MVSIEVLKVNCLKDCRIISYKLYLVLWHRNVEFFPKSPITVTFSMNNHTWYLLCFVYILA